jgi:hypothetical protein
MICKKCGREYDIRAEKALRWMKFFFLSLLAFVAIAWIASFFLNPESRIGFVDFCARRLLVGATGLPFYQLFTILSFVVIISLCIAIYASFFLMLNNRNPVLSHISIGCFIAFIIFLFASHIKTIRTITANTRALLSPPETDTPPTDTPSDTPTDIS